MTTFMEQRYVTLQGLELSGQADEDEEDNLLHYSGRAAFPAESKEVVHEVQVWQAQQDFLEGFLVASRGSSRGVVVMSIRLENGVVIGETAATEESPPTEESGCFLRKEQKKETSSSGLDDSQFPCSWLQNMKTQLADPIKY